MGVASLIILYLREGDVAGAAGMSIIFGIGSTTIIITALAMISNMIGKVFCHFILDDAGFVYGFVSFCDKFSTGVLIVLIQSIENIM